jgi:molybdenum cofactor synthesis domain-containing protein
LVLTISDRAAAGACDDASGPAVAEVLAERLPDADVTCRIVSDDPSAIETALLAHRDFDVILTTGGTGLGPRDNTPDVTQRVCDRLVPGIAEFLRARSCDQTPYAALSRAAAGVRERTLIVNLPGSPRGARFCAAVVAGLLTHAVDMVAGHDH